MEKKQLFRLVLKLSASLSFMFLFILLSTTSCLAQTETKASQSNVAEDIQQAPSDRVVPRTNNDLYTKYKKAIAIQKKDLNRKIRERGSSSNSRSSNSDKGAIQTVEPAKPKLEGKRGIVRSTKVINGNTVSIMTSRTNPVQ